jgi:hypothetical protein
VDNENTGNKQFVTETDKIESEGFVLKGEFILGI